MVTNILAQAAALFTARAVAAVTKGEEVTITNLDWADAQIKYPWDMSGPKRTHFPPTR